MHFEGILIGVLTFLIIGLFHPIVIKTEYYFSKNVWPIFAVVGVVFMLLSIFTENTTISIMWKSEENTMVFYKIEAKRIVNDDEKREKLELAIDKIRDRYGKGSVTSANVINNDIGI